MTHPPSGYITCRWCTRQHTARFLCDPVRQLLDAIHARGASYNMPTIEFPEPIPADQLGLNLGPDDRLVSQLTINAAVIPVAGVTRPMVILSGRDPYGSTLPRWLYAGEDDDMTRLVQLVTDMTDMAVRAAAKARG